MMRTSIRMAALALVAALGLAACAVPGQEAPGVAAIYRDRVITHQQVTDVYRALDGVYSRPHPGEALTLLLIGPPVIEVVEAYGFTVEDADLRAGALAWMSSQRGAQTEPTRAQLELVRVVQSIDFLLTQYPGGFDVLVALVSDIEENSVVSARDGAFTAAAFSQALGYAIEYRAELASQLSPPYIAFKDIDGFRAEDPPEWVSGA